uniref:Uncharacterized protein n=1 Tax=Oryza brachyantha TaxID=4533 RepID=J3LSI5_ORYBR
MKYFVMDAGMAKVTGKKFGGARVQGANQGKRIRIRSEEDAVLGDVRLNAGCSRWTRSRCPLPCGINPLNQKKIVLPCVEKDLPKNCKCLRSHRGSLDRSPRCAVLAVDADEPVIWFCRVGRAGMD